MESLVGKLGHASRVVPPGKTSMMHMFELLGDTRQAHHRSLPLRPLVVGNFPGDMEWREHDANP